MAYCVINTFSKALENYVDLIVLYPTPHNADVVNMRYEEIYRKKSPRVLYLLHGALDDYTSWLRGSGIERYAEEAGICVVMPSLQNSFCADKEHGLQYFTYITTELPRMLQSMFGTSSRREDSFIAGLSMGGYSAMKAAFTRPDLYRAAASFSGAIRAEDSFPIMDQIGMRSFDVDGYFGGREAFRGSRNDLFRLAEEAKGIKPFPELYFACGTQDEMVYPGNRSFLEKLREYEIPYTYRESPGVHNWDFWDPALRQFFEWLTALIKREEKTYES